VADLLAQRVRAGRADGQQPVPVRAGAGASAAGLDAEQVVEQRDDEVAYRGSTASRMKSSMKSSDRPDAV